MLKSLMILLCIASFATSSKKKSEFLDVTDTVSKTQIPIPKSHLKEITPISPLYNKLFMNKHDIVNIVTPKVHKIDKKLLSSKRKLKNTVFFKLPKHVSRAFRSQDIRKLNLALTKLRETGSKAVQRYAASFSENLMAMAPVSLSKQLGLIKFWTMNELEKFTNWHLVFSSKILQELVEREKIWRENDEKNRQESEKLYQLQVIENVRMRSQIVKMANVHLDMLDLMMSIMSQLKNSIFFSVALKSATIYRHADLNRDMDKTLKGDDKKFRDDLLEMEREMVADYLENETYNV